MKRHVIQSVTPFDISEIIHDAAERTPRFGGA